MTTTPKRLLVPVDFSRCSLTALDHALFLASKLGASIEVLHVWEPPAYVTPEMLFYTRNERGLTVEEHARHQAASEMEQLLAKLDRSGVPVHGRVDTGPIADTIVRTAEGCDMIVMGTHGRTGLSRLIIGSVAEKVVRRASCPVVTVRTKEG